MACNKSSGGSRKLSQDNYFAHHVGRSELWMAKRCSYQCSPEVGPIGLYGVCDGHGPFGHLVSFRLVTWPRLILPESAKDQWDSWRMTSHEQVNIDRLKFCWRDVISNALKKLKPSLNWGDPVPVFSIFLDNLQCWICWPSLVGRTFPLSQWYIPLLSRRGAVTAAVYHNQSPLGTGPAWRIGGYWRLPWDEQP